MPRLNLHLARDDASRRPLYRQIAQAIRSRIDEGSLPRGSKMPTVRELAEDLGVNPLTVHHAYRHAQAEGWLEAFVGRGTYVARGASALAEVTRPADGLTPAGVMAEMNRFATSDDVLSLAMAEGDPELYPASSFFRVLASLEKDAVALMRYGSPRGDGVLRGELSALLEARGIDAGPGDILVTTGVTQGMSLVLDALCGSGDAVVVEEPTYLGLLGVLASKGIRPLGIPLDAEGPRLDVLREVVQAAKPRFFYTIPTFQNPTGISMSAARRAGLLDLCRELDLVVVEDDTYGRLAYDGPPPPPLKARDEDERVIYLDGFSKALLPGLRTGYIVAPGPIRERLLSLLQVQSFCQPPLLQRALAEFLRRGGLDTHLKRALPIYKSRRDTMLDALDAAMPEEVCWTRPQGGFCCWVTLPPSAAFENLYRAALARGVGYTPGEVFETRSSSQAHMRLCFGATAERDLRTAVGILGALVTERVRDRQSDDAPPLV